MTAIKWTTCWSLSISGILFLNLFWIYGLTEVNVNTTPSNTFSSLPSLDGITNQTVDHNHSFIHHRSIIVAHGKDVCDITMFPFTIHIITYNRPESLQRLLQSLVESEYHGDCINLHISIDTPKSTTLVTTIPSDETDEKVFDLRHQKVIEMAQSFEWKYGTKNVTSHRQHQGLVKQWLTVWEPQSNEETAIILEDDLQVSPHWYTWWKQMYFRYARDVSEIVGISLQRQYLIPHLHSPLRRLKPHPPRMQVHNQHQPYLYLLVGSWGYAPVASRWRQFQSWYHSLDHSQFQPLVPHLITTSWWSSFQRQGKTETMWTQHFIYWCNQHEQYTLYANLPNDQTLCSNWQEPGEHFDGASSNKPDHPRLLEWTNELNVLPQQLACYDWKAQHIKTLFIKAAEEFEIRLKSHMGRNAN